MQKSSQSATFAVYLFMFSLYSTLGTNNRKAVCYYSRFNCISGLILRIHISSFVIFGIPDGSYHTLQILLRLLVLWHHSKVAFSMTKTNDESYPFNFEKSWNLFFSFLLPSVFLLFVAFPGWRKWSGLKWGKAQWATILGISKASWPSTVQPSGTMELFLKRSTFFVSEWVKKRAREWACWPLLGGAQTTARIWK